VNYILIRKHETGEDKYVFGLEAVWFVKWVTIFHRKVLFPSSLNPEDGGDRSSQTVSTYLLIYRPSYFRRKYTLQFYTVSNQVSQHAKNRLKFTCTRINISKNVSGYTKISHNVSSGAYE
jgi:hypothetical protein